MEILVFGAGAIGSLFGGLLSQKYDVTLLSRKLHADAVERNGLRIRGKTNLIVYPKARVNINHSYDLILLTVKSYDTEEAAKQIKRNISEDTIVLSLQNGLGNESLLAKYIGKRHLLKGLTSHGVIYLKPGVIYHSGIGETVIGELDGKITERVVRIAEIFDSVGIKTTATKNIEAETWVKVIINACINPLTAVTNLRNSAILKIPELRNLSRAICREAVEVANRAADAKLSYERMIREVENVARLTAENKSSMLQDIENKRRTEIDFINGKIVELGRKYQIDTPVNSALVALVKSIESSR